LRAEKISYSPRSTKFELVFPEGRIKIGTALVGQFNVYNVLAALAVVYSENRPLLPAIEALKSFRGVPGRFQCLVHKKCRVIIDFAHKPDALENALKTLCGLGKGKVYIVFGCGGNRDQSKRPLMTTIAQKYAHFCWATTDNPRDESQEDIFDDMRRGVTQPHLISFVADRREAIRRALAKCRPDDYLLIAGKGHESHQEIRGNHYPFNDLEIVKSLL
jgi:UDP-N-acetylmuramoyl-L-alanyl-D-glutamate--2,6-diaminopimelate ligase